MDKEKINLEPEEKAILEYLIILGTPSYFRAKLWMLCSGAKKELEENKNYYKNLLELSKKIPCFYESQIIKDIPRTKPDIINNNPSLQEKMKNVLLRLLEVLQNEVK